MFRDVNKLIEKIIIKKIIRTELAMKIQNDETEEKQINLAPGDDRITLTMILNNASSW
jgi:hypothetical protein